MKKLLVVHNKYQFLGGEDIAVENEVNFLKKYFEVKVIYFDNNIDNIFKQLFWLLINYNYTSYKDLKFEISNFKPEIIYIHNTWFKASLSIFHLIKNLDIEVFVKIHNFRFSCANTYFLKKHIINNKFCLACGLKTKRFKIFNKYFQDSYLKSLFAIRFNKKYLKILKEHKLKILVLTEFSKKFLIQNGFNESKITLFPNYLKQPDISKEKINEKYLVYAGRISDEKGVNELIEGFCKSDLSDWKLKIVGQGPEFAKLSQKFKNSNIIFHGELTNSETLKIIENSSAVITATKLFEGQPTLLCEASMYNKLSIFPKSGGMSEFFSQDYKFSFDQFDYLDLVKKINLLKDFELTIKQGIENKKFISHYLDEEKLLKIFENLVNE